MKNLLTFVLGMFVASMAHAETICIDSCRFDWSAASGEVIRYFVYVKNTNGEWEYVGHSFPIGVQFYTVDWPLGEPFVVSVTGTDVNGAEGERSDPSDEAVIYENCDLNDDKVVKGGDIARIIFSGSGFGTITRCARLFRSRVVTGPNGGRYYE